jgi:hypothetical protein
MHFAHTMFYCMILKTTIIPLDSINGLLSVMETQSVLYDVGG